MPSVRWTRPLAVVPVVAALAACAVPPPRAPGRPAPHLPATVVVRQGTEIRPVDLEAYVLGSVLAEVTPAGESDAVAARILEVQAVLARTYAVTHVGRHRAERFDLCDQTHCQRYDPARLATSSFAAIAREAVRRTEGQIVWFAGAPAETLYHADCGGETAAAVDVWGAAVPYLVPIADELPSVRHRDWTRVIAAADLQRALDRDERSRSGAAPAEITVGARDISGRAAIVRWEDDAGRRREITGELFRAIVNRTLGAATLLSTRFEVSRDRQGFRFAGAGFGHGVGLCQVGAAARARRGDALATILEAYYPGTVVGVPAMGGEMPHR